MIPRFKPLLGWAEFTALFKSNKGAVERFEKAFAKKFKAVDAVTFSYGRSALWAFFKAVGIENAEIIMPAYTCSVVAHAVTLSGNKPRFIDITLDDYNMNLDEAEAAINENTRAIIATHTFGYPQDLDRLEAMVKRGEDKYGHKIWLMQDCCHAFGAEWQGRMIGTSGDVAVYALNISKMITAIFGGMLTFHDQALADKVRNWRNAHYRPTTWLKAIQRRLYLLAVYVVFNEKVYGLTWWLQEKTPMLNRFTKSYHLDGAIHFPPDFNENMLNVEAAVGMVQLAKYQAIVELRRKNAELYSHLLLPRDKWFPPQIVPGATYSHYVVRVPDRKVAISDLGRRGVQLGELIQYSVPELPAYGGNKSCRSSGIAALTTVNLPLMTDRPEVVVENIKEFLNRGAINAA
jgi:perosamine synthetase